MTGSMKDWLKNRRMFNISIFLGMIVLLLPFAAHSARPLISDDTGTLGKGTYQIEMGFDVSDQRQDYDDVVTKEKKTSINTTFSYGILDNLDIILGVPYEKKKVDEDDVTTYDEKGFTDLTLEAKWRFFEKGGFSFALRPGLSLPTGNDGKGLGNGRMTGWMIFIATKELEPFAFHLNVGYRRNENKSDERKDIWGADLAGEVRVHKSLKLVSNVGIVTNRDRHSATDPSFVLGGLVYTVRENFDIDLGYKRGLNKAEAENTYIAGFTWKF